MAEKTRKSGKYAVQNIESLRATINREFIIRLQPKDGKSQLVGFTRFCSIVGELHAEHFAKKGIRFKGDVPRFKMGAACCKYKGTGTGNAEKD